MAFACFPLLMLAVLALGLEVEAFVTLKCEPDVVGLYGQQSRLNCVIQYADEVEDPKIFKVTWWKEGVEGPVLTYAYGKFNSLPGYSFAEPSWNNQNPNVSLLIHNTAVKDDGVYTCMVKTDSGNCNDEECKNNKLRLRVTAKYGKPTFEKQPPRLNRNMDGAVKCSSSDGYPRGRLEWFEGRDKHWNEQPEVQWQETENGLFRLSSTLKVQKGSVFSTFTCKVFNAGGEQEAEESFTVPDSPTNEELGGNDPNNPNDSSDLATKIVAPVVVIGSLIVGLLAALLLFRRRSQQLRRNSTAPLMSHHEGVPTRDVDIEEGSYQESEEDAQSQEETEASLSAKL